MKNTIIVAQAPNQPNFMNQKYSSAQKNSLK